MFNGLAQFQLGALETKRWRRTHFCPAVLIVQLVRLTTHTQNIMENECSHYIVE